MNCPSLPHSHLSIYEWNDIKTTKFPLFQDDCHFTDDFRIDMALAESILTGESCASLMKRYFLNYPDAGYGSNFLRWAQCADACPYNSGVNGAAMRSSPAAWAFAFYGGVPEPNAVRTLDFLNEPLRRVTVEFNQKFVRHRYFDERSAVAVKGKPINISRGK